MARPRKEIDWVEFDKLCGIQCTQAEISAWFECSVDTIERAVKREFGMGFAEYFRQKSVPGKISLRRQMFQLAIKGDKTMLIWLSKQHLGYSERIDQNNHHLIEQARELSALPKEELVRVAQQELERIKESDE